MTTRHIVCVIAVLCSCVLAVAARAQQPTLPEDPEDEKQIGLWLDQVISTGLSANKSLDVEFHERFDEGASNLYEHFVQGGIAFRPRPWFTLIPIYRYQRFPGNPTIEYENRLQLNLTLPIPVIFGVLTLDNEDQAWERLGGTHGHKGEEAAITALKMIHILRGRS